MRLFVNGRLRDVDAAGNTTLLATLRGPLALTGAKPACERGECGACTVLVNDEPVYACLALTIGCEGSAVTTVEGLASGGSAETLHPVTDLATQSGLSPGIARKAESGIR